MVKTHINTMYQHQQTEVLNTAHFEVRRLRDAALLRVLKGFWSESESLTTKKNGSATKS